jgi:hypothetical protein
MKKKIALRARPLQLLAVVAPISLTTRSVCSYVAFFAFTDSARGGPNTYVRQKKSRKHSISNLFYQVSAMVFFFKYWELFIPPYIYCS